MRPLTPVVREYRLLGTLFMLGGLPPVAAAAVSSSAPRILAQIGVMAVVMAGVMHLVLFWHTVRRAVDRVREPPTPERETRPKTLARVVTPTVVLAVVAIALPFVSDAGYSLAGVLLGQGAATLFGARRLDRWEHEHGRVLLREPRLFPDPYVLYAEP